MKKQMKRVLALFMSCTSMLGASSIAFAVSSSTSTTTISEDIIRGENTKTDLNTNDFNIKNVNSAKKTISASATYLQLRDLGFTHNGACGIMGNIKQESTFNPNLEFERSDGSGGYYGLFQWNYDADSTVNTEMSRLMAYCRANNLDYTNASSQLDFLQNDLKKGNSTTGRAFQYPKIWDILQRSSSTPEICASVFCVGYERCVGGADNYSYKNLYWPYKSSINYNYQQLEKRISYSNQFSNQFAKYKNNWSNLDASGSQKKFKDVKSSDYYANAVAWGTRRKITSGVTDNTFSPNSTCTRGQVAQMLTQMERLTTKTSMKNPFKDVKSSAWYYKAVMKVYSNGIMNGVSSNLFQPESACTRAQVCQTLYSLNGSPKTSGRLPFKDVKSSAWYYDAVRWAFQEGIISGTSSSTFAPDKNCTRAQLITILYNYTCKS